MTNNFENAALAYRELNPRDGRRCFSPLLRHGLAPIGAAAARSLPKSESVGGPRFPDDPRLFAQRVWAPSVWLRPYVVDSMAELAERRRLVRAVAC
jgi:hypothetical protein